MDTQQELVFELSPHERRVNLVVFFVWLVLLLSLTTGVFTWVAIRQLMSEPRTMLDFLGILFYLFLALFLPSWVYRTIVREAHRMGWFAGRLRVNKESISWDAPNRTPRTARWSELRYVNPSQRLLYFDRGPVIRLGFTPLRLISSEELPLDKIIEISGPHPLLQKAFEAQSLVKKPPKSEKTFRLVATTITFVVLFAWAAYVRTNDVEQKLGQALLPVIFLLGCLIAGLPHLKRQYAISKEFHPPRKERSKFTAF